MTKRSSVGEREKGWGGRKRDGGERRGVGKRFVGRWGKLKYSEPLSLGLWATHLYTGALVALGTVTNGAVYTLWPFTAAGGVANNQEPHSPPPSLPLPPRSLMKPRSGRRGPLWQAKTTQHCYSSSTFSKLSMEPTASLSAPIPCSIPICFFVFFYRSIPNHSSCLSPALCSNGIPLEYEMHSV